MRERLARGKGAAQGSRTRGLQLKVGWGVVAVGLVSAVLWGTDGSAKGLSRPPSGLVFPGENQHVGKLWPLENSWVWRVNAAHLNQAEVVVRAEGRKALDGDDDAVGPIPVHIKAGQGDTVLRSGLASSSKKVDRADVAFQLIDPSMVCNEEDGLRVRVVLTYGATMVQKVQSIGTGQIVGTTIDRHPEWKNGELCLGSVSVDTTAGRKILSVVLTGD